jgi:hypothetical protein
MFRPAYALAGIPLVLALAAPPVALGQEQRQTPPQTRAEQGRQNTSGQPPTGQAVPRGSGSQAGAPTRQSAGDGGSTAQAAPRERSTPSSTAGQAVPRTSRPRGDQPATGTATVRTQPRVPAGRTVYYRPITYYPYGAYGLGYFYYDPYWMGSPYGYGGYGGYGGHYGAPVYRADYGTGAVRLRVSPREALVHVNGYYVGQVDDFDGIFQRLRLEAGPHRIEIRAPGYEPLVFEVRLQPGQTITYRGELQPAATR